VDSGPSKTWTDLISTFCAPQTRAFVHSQGQFPTQLSLHIGLPEGPESGMKTSYRREG
jgi:hypothetical protein